MGLTQLISSLLLLLTSLLGSVSTTGEPDGRSSDPSVLFAPVSHNFRVDRTRHTVGQFKIQFGQRVALVHRGVANISNRSSFHYVANHEPLDGLKNNKRILIEAKTIPICYDLHGSQKQEHRMVGDSKILRASVIKH